MCICEHAPKVSVQQVSSRRLIVSHQSDRTPYDTKSKTPIPTQRPDRSRQHVRTRWSHRNELKLECVDVQHADVTTLNIFRFRHIFRSPQHLVISQHLKTYFALVQFRGIIQCDAGHESIIFSVQIVSYSYCVFE